MPHPRTRLQGDRRHWRPWAEAGADRTRQRVHRLSAGEAQRLALARALAGARGLLIVDEPTSRQDEANARAVAALLALSVSILVLAGVLATPFLIDAIAPGFSGEKRELTIRIVRILFPGAGLFVFSAWCLGILNSHRRFFLS